MNMFKKFFNVLLAVLTLAVAGALIYVLYLSFKFGILPLLAVVL